MAGIPKGRMAAESRFGICTRLSGWGRYPCCLSWCTAVHFCAEVLQVALSTPGVLLPRFPVTLRTASTLPLKEWVSVSDHAKPATIDRVKTGHLRYGLASTLR